MSNTEGREETSEREEIARKIKPQYSEGNLVRVAIGRQLPEGELIENLLLEHGVPSTLRRTSGFDVPEMLAGGPCDVLVPESGVAAAREVLLQTGMADREASTAVTRRGWKLIGLEAAVACAIAIALLIDAVT